MVGYGSDDNGYYDRYNRVNDPQAYNSYFIRKELRSPMWEIVDSEGNKLNDSVYTTLTEARKAIDEYIARASTCGDKKTTYDTIADALGDDIWKE